MRKEDYLKIPVEGLIKGIFSIGYLNKHLLKLCRQKETQLKSQKAKEDV